MKKIFAIILLGVFLISLTSAWEGDNGISDYWEEEELITFKNGCFLGVCLGDTIGQVQLKTPKDFKVGAGDNYVWEMDAWVYEDYNDFLKGFEFEDMNNGRAKVNRDIDIKIFKGIVNVLENTYGCLEYGDTKNETNACINYGVNGSKLVEKEVWEKVTPADIKKADGRVTLRGYTNVQVGDKIDWSPLIFGVRVSHEIWATWTESLNVNLAAYYKEDEQDTTGTGTIINQLGINGTNSGTDNSTGKINTAYDFEESANNYITTNTGAVAGEDLDFTGDYSVSMWIKPESFPNTNHYIISKRPTSGDYQYNIRIDGATQHLGILHTGGAVLSDGGAIPTGIWTHVVVTNDAGGNVIFYINGSQDGSAQATTSISHKNGDTWIGTVQYQTADAYDGLIDEVGFWNRTLTPSEITQLWNNGDGISYTATFGTAPSVTLTSPANNSNLTSPNIDFITTVTDDEQVDNVTLNINGLANQTNTSGFNGSYTFTVMGLSDGIYNWSILAVDNNSNINQSETRIFNLTIPPIFIDLLSPADVSTHNTPIVNMSCTAYKDVGVTQLNLTIDGVTNISITNTSIAENLTISQDVNFSEGNYTWGCSAINPSTSAVSSNRTFEVLYSSPVVNLFEPTNDSSILINSTTFIFNASDVNGIDNVTLYIDGVLNETNSSGIEGNYSFFRTLADGFYNWSVTATSTLGKITNSATRFFTLHTEIPVVNITAPSGTLDYFLLGENETLIYNVSEIGESVSHFERCWFYYGENTDSLNQSDIPTPYTIANYSFNYDNSTTAPGLLITRNTQYDEQSPVTEFYSLKNCNTSLINATSYCHAVGFGYACSNNFTCNGEVVSSVSTHANSIFETRSITNITQFNGNYNETLNCSENQTNFIYIDGQNNITVFAKDDFSFIANDTSTWEYKILEINQTYVNETVEGSTQDISALIKLADSLTISAVILDYNGTLSAGTSSISGENILILESGLVTPNVEAEENLTFKWSIILSGGEIINLSEQTQTVTNIDIDNCSTFTNKILDMTMVDEELQTSLSNTTLEIAINIFSLDGSTEVVDFSDEFQGVNPIEICLNINISEDISYFLDSIIRYTATGYANEYYNIVGYTLDNNSQTQNLTLYDLNITDSTDFQLTFTGDDYLPVENALVLVERQYISENVFKTVEIPKTDSNGQTVLHLVRNDVIYNIVVMKDGAILGNFANVIAFCDDFTIGDCSLPLNAISNVSLVFDYNDEIGLIYEENTQYNETTGIASFSFASTDGTTKVVIMNIERRDVFGNRTICTNTLVSSSGSVSCQVDTAITDTTLVSIISVDGQDKIYSEVIIDSTAYGQNGYAMFFIFAVGIFLMFSGSKTWTLVGVALEYIIGVSLGLIIGGVAGAGSTGIFVLIISMVGIWQLNKGRKQ